MGTELFEDIKADLYLYMVSEGGLQKKTSHDYISRLSFLAQHYRIDECLTEDDVREIMRQEDEARHHRNVYTSKHAMGDLRAGLRKVLEFFESQYRIRKQEEIEDQVAAIAADNQISTTEKAQIIQARVGQGLFRRQLIDYWHGCAVSGCAQLSVMIASHIKPWCSSNNIERLDPYNGLLLLPNYDKLFDKGLMTFTTSGEAVFSGFINQQDLSKMGISLDAQLLQIDERHKPYLEYHNEHCFIE